MPKIRQLQCFEIIDEIGWRAGMGLSDMEEMLHFAPSDKRGRTGYQKIFNVHCLLRIAEHMLYWLSKSFKIDNREVLVDGALFLTEKNPFLNHRLKKHISQGRT
jgi:hypothetical protein